MISIPASSSAAPADSAAPVVAPVPVRTAPASAPTRTVAPADSLAVPADSLAADTVPRTFGILLTPPRHVDATPKSSSSFGLSVILAALFLLFAVIGLRFRNNRKYVTSMLRNLVETRLRSNAFDETVRETSFIVLLNLLWSCSAGFLLYAILLYSAPPRFEWSFAIPALTLRPAASLAVCIAVAVVYTAFMAVAYTVVGWVFSDAQHARLWLKGFAASQGLLAFIWFPLALVAISHPAWAHPLILTAFATFIIAKIVFIWKGFRIFFSQISSWVLFLYYLCSLEIVPLILTFMAAMLLCGLLG